MANTEGNHAQLVQGVGNGVSQAVNPPGPPNILEQSRLGNLNLFRDALDGDHNRLLNFTDVRYNRTPLHLAAMAGHTTIVEFILRFIVTRPEISREVVNAKDHFGYTPLHLAVRHMHENVVRLLTRSSLVLPDRFLAATSELDDIGWDCGGCTPLHLAAVGGHIDIARLLLRQPCHVDLQYDPVNIFAISWGDLTPLDLARKNKFWEFADVLEASDLNWLQQERARSATSANAVLVGAALVAAAAFGAWLQPPGGLPTPSSRATSGAPSPGPSAFSSSVSSDENFLYLFYMCVMSAFALSLHSLLYGILATFPYRGASLKVNLRLLRRSLDLARSCLLMALLFLIVAFSAACAIVLYKVSDGKSSKILWFMTPFLVNLIYFFGLYLGSGICAY